jgi:hypothetical protein
MSGWFLDEGASAQRLYLILTNNWVLSAGGWMDGAPCENAFLMFASKIKKK